MAATPLLFQGDFIFWYQTQRVFGAIVYGGADFNETVTTTERIATSDVIASRQTPKERHAHEDHR